MRQDGFSSRGRRVPDRCRDDGRGDRRRLAAGLAATGGVPPTDAQGLPSGNGRPPDVQAADGELPASAPVHGGCDRPDSEDRDDEPPRHEEREAEQHGGED